MNKIKEIFHQHHETKDVSSSSHRHSEAVVGNKEKIPGQAVTGSAAGGYGSTEYSADGPGPSKMPGPHPGHSDQEVSTYPAAISNNTNTTTQSKGNNQASASTSSKTHVGRDEATIGGVSAVSDHMHRNNLNEHSISPETNPATSSTPGKYNTITASLLDPAMQPGSPPIEDASVHHPKTGGGGESADRAHQ